MWYQNVCVHRYLVDRTERDGAIIGDSALKERYDSDFFLNNNVQESSSRRRSPKIIPFSESSTAHAVPGGSRSPSIATCVDRLYCRPYNNTFLLSFLHFHLNFFHYKHFLKHVSYLDWITCRRCPSLIDKLSRLLRSGFAHVDAFFSK